MTPQDWETELPLDRYDKAAGYETKDHRECDGESQASADCDLRIWPIANVHTLSKALITPEGVVVARIDNVDVGKKKEKLLKIPPGDSTYWVVYRDGNRYRSAFVIPSQQGKTYTELPYNVCEGDNHKPNPGATKARFWLCKDVQPFKGMTPKQIDSVMYFTEHRSPPWITCSEGCCNAEQ
jgi:hypothetical protein